MISPERRGVPWLWFLVPVFSLIVFFGLRSCKDAPPARAMIAPRTSSESE